MNMWSGFRSRSRSPSDYLLCLNRNGKIKAIGGKSQIEEKVERYDLTWGDSVIPPIFNGLLFSFVMSNDGSIYLFSKRKKRSRITSP